MTFKDVKSYYESMFTPKMKERGERVIPNMIDGIREARMSATMAKPSILHIDMPIAYHFRRDELIWQTLLEMDFIDDYAVYVTEYDMDGNRVRVSKMYGILENLESTDISLWAIHLVEAPMEEVKYVKGVI